jgi:hypothetical protein
MSALHQSLQYKATRLPDPPQPINLILFLANAGKGISKSRISAMDANVTTSDSPINSDFRIQWSNGVPHLNERSSNPCRQLRT